MDFLEIKQELTKAVVFYVPKLVIAVLILLIGFSLIKFLLKIFDKFLLKSKVDLSLHSFIISLSEAVLRIVVVITAASAIDIPTTAFLAVLSTAGLAIGLATKDSLSNLAGGILILSFRPFNVGDFIEAKTKSGTVKEIKILYTHIITPDNKRIVIPNGDLANTEITNFSTEKHRRVDLVFPLDESVDIDQARSIIKGILDKNDLVLKIPSPSVHIESIEESTVKIIVKAWTNTDNYLDVFYSVQEMVKKKLDAEKVKGMRKE